MGKFVFNNKRMTELLTRYSKSPEDVKLRNRILEKTLPLVEAAISRKRLFHIRGDLVQECSLKIMYALPKYKERRGGAFGFLWTVICNTCLTHAERLSRASLSLDTEPESLKEAEATVQPLDPATAHILKKLSSTMDEAFVAKSLRSMERGKAKRIQLYLRQAISTGELFNNRRNVLVHLKEIGLNGVGSKSLIDRALVMVRSKLYTTKTDLPQMKPRSRYYNKHTTMEEE